MKILVTGGAGYVGSVLVPLLLEYGHDVRVLDILRRGGVGLMPICRNLHFELQVGDINDPTAVEAALVGVDAVVHLAAVVGYPQCNRTPELAVATNIDGTSNILKHRQRSVKLIYASTGSVYGRVNSGECTEDTDCRPLSLYAETKAAAEDIVLAEPNTTVLRFATAFGASSAMRYDLLVNHLLNQAVRHGCLVVYEPEARRSFIHVLDMARAVLLTLDAWNDLPHRVFNVGDDGLNQTKLELCGLISNSIPSRVHQINVGSDIDARDYAVSYSRMRQLGFRSTVSLVQGIEELAVAMRLSGGETSQYE